MAWPSSQGTGGPTFEIAPGFQQRDRPEWWECGDYLGINFSPKFYAQISELPQVVLPQFSTSTMAIETRPLSSNRVAPPMQTQPIDFGDAIKTAQGTYPVQNSPLPTGDAALSQHAATFSVDGVAITAIKPEGQTNIVQLGLASLSVGGSAYTSASHTFSLASSGLLMDGALAASFSAVNAGPSVAGLALGRVTATAQQVNSGTARLGSWTLSVGGPAIITAGHVISLAPGGIVMDGTSTAAFTSAQEPLSDLGTATSEASETSTKKPSPKTSKQSLGAPAVSWKLSSFLFLGLQSFFLIL
jgi:hypothetical protein